MEHRPAAGSGLKSRLQSIDALRGMAAIAVVVHHAFTQGSNPASAPWFSVLRAVTEHGKLGVALFFVISGFCIHLRAAKQAASGGREAQQVNFVSFWRRRMWRLYPAYFVVLCGSMALVVGARWLQPDAVLLSIYPEPTLSWIAADFASHVFMLHGLIPMFDFAGGNPPFWSLAREEYLYLMYFPLLIAMRRRGVLQTFIAITLLGIGTYISAKYVLGFTGPLLRTISASALVLWVQWYLGAVAVEAYFGVIRLPRFFTRMSSAALFAVVALVSGEYVEMMAPLLWGLTFFCLVNAVVKRESRGDWPKRRMRFWAFSGEISYSLYLVHLPAMFVMGWVVRRFVSTNDPVQYTLVALLLAGASYVVAWLFFLLVERHFIAPRQRPVARLRAMEAA